MAILVYKIILMIRKNKNFFHYLITYHFKLEQKKYSRDSPIVWDNGKKK